MRRRPTAPSSSILPLPMMPSDDEPVPVFGEKRPGQIYIDRPSTYAIIADEHGRLAVVGTERGRCFLPGGGIDPGESDEQALRRELREELGVEHYELGPLLWEDARWFALDPDFCGQNNRHYLVRVPDDEVRHISEARDSRWFTAEEILALPNPPYDLENLLRFLQSDCTAL